MKKWKSLPLFATITIAATVVSFYFLKPKNCNDCNLVVFDADIFRADGLDCESHPEVTPNLCEIEDNFLKFNNHHSHTDLTKPGISSFLTSSYPSTHGVWNEFFLLSEEQPNLVNILKENGYHTIVSGEFNNSQVTSDIYDGALGDEAYEYESDITDLITIKPTFIFIYNGDLHYPYLSNDSDTFITHPKKPTNFPNNTREFGGSADKVLAQKYSDVFENSAIKEFIKNQDGSTEGVYEYFSYLCWSADIEDKIVNVNACWQIVEKTFEQYIDINNPDHIEFAKYLYQERIKEVDKIIAQLINGLKSDGLWDKTVFAIRSDHGEEFMEHGKLDHSNDLYEELVRVPFWIHVPGQNGGTINNLTQTIDEAPTLLNILGIEPHPLMIGRDLLDPSIYESQVDFAIAQKLLNPVFSIRDGDYKLISKDNIEYELYDLKDDSGEENNIVEENLKIKEKLLSKYHSIINQQPRFEPSNEFFERLTDEQKNNLYENSYF
ncbi:MAG: sulfatase-like hydrolase/transferase [Candidatus Pacebacteria bacterium]|jgi:arylsulfatase A-like enzyme|nr:sulfatase-like hydrolase/transferase [Candidatus Paceibacterota bacterium]MBT3512228.1 sulfatase-like hydrolase/transferase [Candidatus Paceibacterota bacterium]MBT4004926.1 sulfatase-like hydrolase/transferase [Candidatus Paceibacterota bacterium]MBT4358908.1 sulfatase-like hydrolase/transferase [Candidatus Paceibacterota bacterium]MBT4680766.1 sulfatase-like hydrolase/transferase [Candidatus Paceibacterota bacterium]